VAKDFAAEQLSFYEAIPSYQKVIAREGIDSAADLAAVGSAESVRRQLQSYLNAGATDVVLSGLAWTGAAVAEELWAVAASV
jgi:alkanesulfonate monooxygenase SsuD/methylene tetrahydromethanopterin reductase-like flavin-dependent oxidoreductase (luciferase family)